MGRTVYLTDEEITLIESALQMKVSELRRFGNTEYTDFTNELVKHMDRHTNLIHKVEGLYDEHIRLDQLWELSKLDENNMRTWNEIFEFNTWMGYEWDSAEEQLDEHTFEKCCEDSAQWTTTSKMIEKLQPIGLPWDVDEHIVESGNLYIITLCIPTMSSDPYDCVEHEFHGFSQVEALWKATKWAFGEHIKTKED